MFFKAIGRWFLRSVFIWSVSGGRWCLVGGRCHCGRWSVVGGGSVVDGFILSWGIGITAPKPAWEVENESTVQKQAFSFLYTYAHLSRCLTRCYLKFLNCHRKCRNIQLLQRCHTVYFRCSYDIVLVTSC